MRKYVAILLFLVAMGLGLTTQAATAHAATNHVVVLDQSGSMVPYWDHPQDRLRQLMKSIISLDGVFGPKDQVSLLFFSEPGAKVPSPQSLFRGSVADLRSQWPDVAPKLKAVWQWTDMIHGLTAGVDEVSSLTTTDARIVWLLTDNVGEVAEDRERQDTVDFYQALKSEPAFAGFTDIEVFPIDLQHPTETQGLMLYTMLWVPPGTSPDRQTAMAERYRSIVASLDASQQPEFMGQHPLLVKPLDKEPFRLELTEFTKEGGKPIPITVKDGKLLLPSGLFKEGEPIRGTLSGRIISNYDTFRIPEARLSAALTDPRTIDFNPVTPGLQRVGGEHLGTIGARESSQPFSIEMELPPLAASWNLQSLLGTKGHVETDLILTVAITSGNGLEFDTSQVSHLTFHAMTELPKLFATDVTLLPVETTLQFPVNYSGARFGAAVAGLVAILALVIGLAIAIIRLVGSRSEWILTNPDGSETPLIFRRWHRKEFIIWEGSVAGLLRMEKAMHLTFIPDGDSEPQPLEEGGLFTATIDDRLLTFRVDPRHPSDLGGEDDVA